MKFTVDPIYLASAADTIRAAAGLRTDDLCRRYRASAGITVPTGCRCVRG